MYIEILQYYSYCDKLFIIATIASFLFGYAVLQQYCKLKEQMEKKHYYSALKTLEQLEHTFLPPVRGYIFSDLLFKEIPKIRKSIEDQSNTDLTVSIKKKYFHSK